MPDCNPIVTQIYQHKDLNNLINKIEPAYIRDDLRQEIAINLLSMPCDRVAALFAADNLLRYTIKMCWVMATSNTSAFSKKFQKCNMNQALDYMKSIQPLPGLPDTLAMKAKGALKNKNKTIYDDHEARIFNKYVELGTSRKVAKHYGIPVNHVCIIVKKVKLELKCLLLA